MVYYPLLLLKKKYFHVISHTCRFEKKLKYLISFKYFLGNETSYTTAYGIKINDKQTVDLTVIE